MRLPRLDIGIGEHRLAELHGHLVSVLQLEYTVDHATMEMLVKRLSEAVYEAHRSQSCLGDGTMCALAQDLLDYMEQESPVPP